MKINTALFTRLFLLGCVLPVIMSSMVYEGFSTNYTVEVFSKPGFEYFYNSGIYKYRILSPFILLKTYDLIKHYDLPTFAPRSLTLMDDDGDPQFYSAYFYMNTFFLCLTSIILLIIFGAHRKNAHFVTVDLPVLLLCSLMTLTQYVIVPYDTLSYFLLCVAATLIISNNKAFWVPGLLGMIVILATLTRETSAFILAFYFAINHKALLTRPTKGKLNQEQWEFLVVSICFLCTYVGLRLLLGYEHAIYQAFLFSRNMNLSNSLFGMLFFASMALIIITGAITKEISIFLVITLPYAVFIFLFAEPWEIRLWMPIILLLIIMKVRAYRPMIV